jgi:hypothetical protein
MYSIIGVLFFSAKTGISHLFSKGLKTVPSFVHHIRVLFTELLCGHDVINLVTKKSLRKGKCTQISHVSVFLFCVVICFNVIKYYNNINLFL